DLMKNRAVVVLDLGARNTVLNIFCPGGPFFTREISTSGHQMTAEIQKQLDVTYDEAERIKREGDPSQLSDILKDPLNQLVFGIRRSLTYYENRVGEGGFHKLYLAGGGSRLVNLVGHLHSKLEVSVEELNPLKGIQVNGNQEALSTVAPQLTLAVGLALRKVGRISV
ncbi:pilus assembly protein PilM, partial [bacterium]|nr:pilus assembly protein PilM [bacterium]